MANVLIILIIIALMAVAVRRIYRTIRYGGSCCSGSSGIEKKVRVKDRNRSNYPYSYELKVDGMVCSGCVGVVFAGLTSGNALITSGGALALALGIAIQNFPEGAIISMPLCAEGNSKGKAFFYGVLSGAVEPIGAVLTIVAASFIIPAMPYLLSFAAGAMMYVVVEELIPEMSEGEHSNIGVVMFVMGFTLMMALDVALG